jgi:serine/threonine protein phosphatase PrpC
MSVSAHSPIRVLAAARTDVGRVRQNNEDAFLCEPTLGLYAVADGMGGHAGGEVASAMAVDGLRRAVAAVPDRGFLADPSLENRREILAFLKAAVSQINAEIYARGNAERSLHGMGCTLDVVLIRGAGLFLAHVGDSRVYGCLGGTLYPMTEDHTFGQSMLSSGALTAEEVANHPQKNRLMRALGVYPKVDVDVAYLDIAPGDVYLLCSDGVHGLVDSSVIQEALKKPSDFAAQHLIDAALAQGGRDNATAVVVQVSSCAAPQPIRVGSEEVRRSMAAASLFAASATPSFCASSRSPSAGWCTRASSSSRKASSCARCTSSSMAKCRSSSTDSALAGMAPAIPSARCPCFQAKAQARLRPTSLAASSASRSSRSWCSCAATRGSA